MRLPYIQQAMFAMHREQFRLGDSSQPVKDHHHIPSLKPQHIGAVMSVGRVQLGRLRWPSFRWKVKAMRRHAPEIRDSPQRLNDEKELPPALKELASTIHSWRSCAKISAVSSAVEHYTDTVGVGSSNLPPRTTFPDSHVPGEKSVGCPFSFQAFISASIEASFFP